MEKCSKIKVLEYDDNYDGVTDEIRLSFDFHSAFKYGIKSFSIVLFLDARLRVRNRSEANFNSEL